MRWSTAGSADQPSSSIVPELPSVAPDVTDGACRTVVEMMPKRTDSADLDGTLARLRAGDADVVCGPDRTALGVAAAAEDGAIHWGPARGGIVR